MARILVVEDDDSFRRMLREMLEVAGHLVSEAENGDVGLAVYKKEPADLVVLDIFMPGKEGIETIIELRHHDPQAKVLAISGGGRHGHLQYLDQALQLGAQRRLAKPFSRDDFLQTVEELLEMEVAAPADG